MNTLTTRGKFFIGSAIVALCIVILLVVFFVHKAFSQTISGWNQADATYLAQRALLDPTPADITALTNAGSAANAVAILFASTSPAETQAYQTGLDSLKNKLNQGVTSKNAITDRNTLYAYQLIHNPNDVQQKLYYLWENIFSVDSQGADPGDIFDKISDQDVTTLDQILYNNAYGNYVSLVQQVQTTYAMAKYLDLVNSSKANPNENYSREMMQLFLMGQYTPLDTKMTNENYTDEDVNNLAYLLTGYRRVGGDITDASSLSTVTASANSANSIYFNPKSQYVGQKLFLGKMVSFPDPTDAITYIVSQRRTQVSEFLANKILKYYVSDNPEPADITTFANIISTNNFEILPSLKWLFSSSIMYRSQYMQEERYKSPLELVASYYTDLYGRNNYAIVPNAEILTDLGFSPMLPGSVFGRPGFDSNSLFFSGTILDKWIGDTDRMLRVKGASTQVQQFLADTISKNNITTPEQFVQYFENTFYLGKKLPQKTEDDITAFLTNNNATPSSTALSTTNPASLNKMIGSLDLLLAQPEFILNSGNPSATAVPQPLKSTATTASSSLVIVRLHGGLDYQQLIANVNDPAYATNRMSLDLDAGNSTPLGNGYVLNNAASALLPLIQSKQVSFVTAVGLPGQIRAHDIASEQMETGLNPNNIGIVGALGKILPTMDLVSLTNAPPILYTGSPSIQMGSADLSLFPELGKDNSSASGQYAAFEQIIKDRLLPQESAAYYSQIALLNRLGEEDVARGGKGTPGPKNATQFPFLESLINEHVGNIYYLYADGTYDFHYDEDPDFDTQISALMKQIVAFYNDESPHTKLTIVIFSEFGRTDKINGNDGTDHGTGGGMTVLSNVLDWPTMIGSLSPSTDTNNWTNVVVDERDVWSSIFNSLYGVPVSTLFGRTQTLASYPVTIK